MSFPNYVITQRRRKTYQITQIRHFKSQKFCNEQTA